MSTQQYKLQRLAEVLVDPPDLSGLPPALQQAMTPLVTVWEGMDEATKQALRAAVSPSVAEAVQKWQGMVAAQAASPDAPESVKALAASQAAKAAATGGTSNG